MNQYFTRKGFCSGENQIPNIPKMVADSWGWGSNT
jgi:hypothetical protein